MRKVQDRNKKTYMKRDVKSSRLHVGCSRNEGIMGTNSEPQNQPATRPPNPIRAALPKLFVLSLRKYTQAPNDIATWNAGPASAEFITLQHAMNPKRNNLLMIITGGGSSTKLRRF